MRHYIYLEENRITYARTKGRLIGKPGLLEKLVLEAKVWETRGVALETAFKVLADHHGLSGKKVTLVLGPDLSFCKMTLPGGRRSVVERMAFNRLSVITGFDGEYAAAVDFRYERAGKKVCASLFYMDKDRLAEYKNMAFAAGITCSRVLGAPHSMAVAVHKLWKEKSHLVVDVEEEQLGLYLLAGGHCLASAVTTLRAGRFLRMKGEELLYQEIAERAETLFQLAGESDGGDSSGFRPECAVLLGDCLPSRNKGASRLEELLELPCISRSLEGETETKAALPPELMAACIGDCFPGKGKPVNVRYKSRDGAAPSVGGIFKILTRGWRIFLLMNIAAALGLGIWTGIKAREAAKELTELRAALMDPEYGRAYREAVDRKEILNKLISRESTVDFVRRESAGKNLLGMDALGAFTGPMDPDMEVESILYEEDDETLFVVVSMSRRAQIPLYVERVKGTGIFPCVNHSSWEQKEEEGKPERFFVVVSASLTDGGWDEAQ